MGADISALETKGVVQVLAEPNVMATNGKEALQLLDEHDPSVIFMDVNMPEMDGLEATLAIRQLPGHKRDIPIIALTADVMKKDKEHCLAAGMDHFVSKPFRLDEIAEALKLYIS